MFKQTLTDEISEIHPRRGRPLRVSGWVGDLESSQAILSTVETCES